MKSNTKDRLNQYMIEHGMKQVDIFNAAYPIAEKLGIKINKSDIHHYIKGDYAPAQDKLLVLSIALNVSEAWLMGLDVSPVRNMAADQEFFKGIEDADLMLRIKHLTPKNRDDLIRYLSYLEHLENR